MRQDNMVSQSAIRPDVGQILGHVIVRNERGDAILQYLEGNFYMSSHCTKHVKVMTKTV